MGNGPNQWQHKARAPSSARRGEDCSDADASHRSQVGTSEIQASTCDCCSCQCTRQRPRRYALSPCRQCTASFSSQAGEVENIFSAGCASDAGDAKETNREGEDFL